MASASMALVLKAVSERSGILRDALLATLIVNTLTLATSLFAMQVYDRVIPNAGFQTLTVLTVGVSLAIIFELLLRHVRSELLDRESTRVDAELAEWFFARALAIRMEARPPTLGTFAAQIRGLEQVRGLLASGPLFILADVPFALFFIGVISFVGGQLAVVPLVMLPLTLLAGLIFQRRISKATAASQGHSNHKAGTLVEAIDGIESIKANTAEDTLAQRWRALTDVAGEEDDRIKHYSTLSANVTQTVQQLGYVALIAYGAFLVTQGDLTMGGLIACSIIGSRALAPIGRLPSVLVQWAHAKAALDGLDRLIECPNEQDDAGQQLDPGKLDASLRFENVRFAYPGNARPALDLSMHPGLAIRSGERVGVVGGIGSGKSTFLKLASGLWRPGDGRVFVGGIDAAMITPGSLRQQVVYVPQDVRLIRGTLRDNLTLGIPDPGDETLLQALKDSGLIDLVHAHSLGLALPISEGGRGISGGQRQLIALTRLLFLQPAILLLDEPTASMDAATETRVVNLLERMAAAGTTLIIATHKTAVMRLLDRLLVCHDGRLLADGPRDTVLAHLSGNAAQPAKLLQKSES